MNDKSNGKVKPPKKEKKKKQKQEKPREEKKKEKKPKLSEKEKKKMFKDAKKVDSLKQVENPVKGQLFKVKAEAKKGNLRTTVFRATGKDGFGKFDIVTSKKSSKIPFRD